MKSFYTREIMMVPFEEEEKPDERLQPSVSSVIPVLGCLETDYYQWIASQVIEHARGPEKTVYLWVSSPGGYAMGLSFLLDTIQIVRANGVKVYALVPDYALSAAYWIASACDAIVTASDAAVGGIGTYIEAYEDSAWLKQLGVVKYVFEAESSPDKVLDLLSEDDRSYLQNKVNESGLQFVEAVATGRSVPDETVITDFGKGQPVRASEALAKKMIDSNNLIGFLLNNGEEV